MVHNTSTDLNSTLHSTTKLNISQYLKHLAKLLNTSSSLNDSREAKMVPLSTLFLNQQGPVRFLYCSTKVFNAYSDEGLTNPRMPFQDFMEMEFFERELEATKKQVEEKGQKKCKRPETEHVSRLCRFCKLELKQGPNSPHIHKGFPMV